MATDLVPITLERRVCFLRGQRVMLDADLADIFCISTKRLNEQVKRNRYRFPADFMFRLTSKEKAEVVAKCDHLRALRFSPSLPAAFTEHGAVMLASVLKNRAAVAASVQIVRVFSRLKEVVAATAEMREILEQHGADIEMILDALEDLREAPPRRPKRIGFRLRERARPT